MDLSLYLKEKRNRVDGFLKKYIASKKKLKNCPEHLSEAMGYSLMAGGKRIRPILSIAGYEALGGRSEGILPVAASLELIHTYSLIHDDLPAMDNDDFRRNKPTNHRVFGEATAILAGDALLSDAFHMIAKADAEPGVLISVIDELSSAIGPEGMVGGQAMDLILEGRKATKKEILYTHTHKTGVFIRTAVRIGGLMAKASADHLNMLSEYGKNIGLAFQVMDDILDIVGTKEEMGKSTGADSARGKNTYPSVFGLDRSEKIADTLINDSVESLSTLNHNADPLREIAKYIVSRRN